MNEAETRAEHIDPALHAAGWGVVEGSRIRREYAISPGRIEGYGKQGRGLTADYILEYRNTKLAVLEAKAWDRALTEGVAQAKNYAGKLALRFAYASNGQGVYSVDMETGKEAEIIAYPSPDELWALTFAKANAWRDRFAAVTFPDKSGSWALRFYHPDGTPMSAQQFMELLYGKLPEFFKSEAELRTLWSAPDTRAKLLQGLAEKDFGPDKLEAMQQLISAENSDLFDVLAYVAYALPPITRAVRADFARVHISGQFSSKQQVFLDFVLQHYVSIGVRELEQSKLHVLLRLRYRDSITDAVSDLGGKPEVIAKAFSGFQKYLYAETAFRS